MADWQDEDDAQGSDGYESPGGPTEHIQVGGFDEEQNVVSSGGSSTGDSSSGSEEESGDEGGGAQAAPDDDLENDLFGPDNEDYMRTTPQSPFPIPRLPELRNDDFRRNFRGNNGAGFLQSHNNNYRNEMLVADMKLGPVGHNDETLRISCPDFQEPRQVCCYSRTADGNVHYDERCLRKFRRRVLSNFEADLNEGFDNFIDKREDLESRAFGDLLTCIRSHIPSKNLSSLKDIHFVTFRNNMNKILGTAYNRRDPWEMGVYKRFGTVYLDVRKLPEPPPTEFQQRQCYWGYKYEEVATENSERDLYEMSGNGGIPVVVDANVEFCTVVRTKLGPHRIIMGAEIDCYDIGSDGGKRYTELKTARELDRRTMERFEKDKLLKFWIQSYLVGVPRIVCGFRDDNGRLLRSDMMATQEVARQMKQKQYWEKGVVLAFADRVLCWLYGSVNEDGNYVLRYVPSGRLELWKEETCPAVINEHIEQLVSERR